MLFSIIMTVIFPQHPHQNFWLLYKEPLVTIQETDGYHDSYHDSYHRLHDKKKIGNIVVKRTSMKVGLSLSYLCHPIHLLFHDIQG